MRQLPRILLTPGEPAGIGPDIVVQIAQETWPADLIAIADPDLLLQRAKQLQLPLTLIECDLHSNEEPITRQHTLKIFPIRLRAKVEAGTLNTANAKYVIHSLEVAATHALRHHTAIVTGPVHKGIINQAGIAFTGHTEFFAQHAQIAQTVMLFVIQQLKVALVTTHLPLANVAKALTKEKLRSTLSILHTALNKQFGITSPRILVCGLNPHAGENGYLGREEVEMMIPLLEELRAEGYLIQGPLPADTIFTPHHLKQADAVLAMYHDQALPLVKYIGFGHAVNMTLGLPYLRTSVDHGTALDVAGSGNADAGSLRAALSLAIELS